MKSATGAGTTDFFENLPTKMGLSRVLSADFTHGIATNHRMEAPQNTEQNCYKTRRRAEAECDIISPMKKTVSHVVFIALALSVVHAFAGGADTSPLRLSPVKIPECAKAHVCQDLPYGGRQVGNGAVHRDVAQTYDLYLPGDIGEIGRVKTSGAFRRTKDGPAETYADFWKLVGAKQTPPESVAMDGIVAVQNYVALTNGLAKAGVPFAARLEPYRHCKILSGKPETRPWLYENLRKHLKENEAK